MKEYNMKDVRIGEWIKETNLKRMAHWDSNFSYKPYTDLEVQQGRKYIKLVDENTVWGFISKTNNPNKGYKYGDLLMPASWNTPAKHARGNVLDGTAEWTYHGPAYRNK